jgi:hypothetical protein
MTDAEANAWWSILMETYTNYQIRTWEAQDTMNIVNWLELEQVLTRATLKSSSEEKGSQLEIINE